MKKLLFALCLVFLFGFTGCEKQKASITEPPATSAPSSTPTVSPTVTPTTIPLTPSKTGVFGATEATPRTILEPRTFEIDCGAGNIKQQLNDIGYLYKGDTVIFKPDTIDTNTENTTVSGYMGADSKDCEALVSNGIATVEYSTYGTANNSGSSSFGTKITITADYAVMLQSYGGGGRSTSKFTNSNGKEGTIAYYACSLTSLVLDAGRDLILKVYRTYGIGEKEEIDISEVFCYDESNIPERMYVVDDNIEFKLGTPVCEGRHFSYWSVDYPSAQRLYCVKHDDNTYRIHTLSTTLQKGDNTVLSEGEPLILEAYFSDGNTVTFNAEGGALDGFDKKIVEIYDSSWLNSFDAGAYVPERIGYTFTGWYADKSCTGDPVTSLVPLRNSETHALDTKLQLYAGWKLNR